VTFDKSLRMLDITRVDLRVEREQIRQLQKGN
jgi:hypothetical protein